jgi:hypothetical protein
MKPALARRNRRFFTATRFGANGARLFGAFQKFLHAMHDQRPNHLKPAPPAPYPDYAA